MSPPLRMSSLSIFQFHKGTIKTGLSFRYLLKEGIFQFHKGTIKTINKYVISDQKIHFNSIKVRLKLPFQLW